MVALNPFLGLYVLIFVVETGETNPRERTAVFACPDYCLKY